MSGAPTSKGLHKGRPARDAIYVNIIPVARVRKLKKIKDFISGLFLTDIFENQ